MQLIAIIIRAAGMRGGALGPGVQKRERLLGGQDFTKIGRFSRAAECFLWQIPREIYRTVIFLVTEHLVTRSYFTWVKELNLLVNAKHFSY